MKKKMLLIRSMERELTKDETDIIKKGIPENWEISDEIEEINISDEHGINDKVYKLACDNGQLIVIICCTGESLLIISKACFELGYFYSNMMESGYANETLIFILNPEELTPVIIPEWADDDENDDF